MIAINWNISHLLQPHVGVKKSTLNVVFVKKTNRKIEWQFHRKIKPPVLEVPKMLICSHAPS